MTPAYRDPSARSALARLSVRLMTLVLSGAAAACSGADSAVGVVGSSAVTGPNAMPPNRPVSDQYIVTFDGTVSDPSARAVELVKQSHGTLRFVYRAAMRGFSASIPQSALFSLRRSPGVSLVEQDRTVTTSDVQSPAPWALDRLDQRSLPLSKSFTYENSGAGVTIYIVDTGIRDTHVEFGGRASGVFTAVADGNGTSDCHGHGTQVAGIAGAAGYGVAKRAQLRAIRVIDCNGSGTTSGVIAGLDWLAANRVQPAVANLSLSGDYSDALNQAVAGVVSAGVTVTVAAGNNGLDACQYSPASAHDAITAGATNSLDTRPDFSNWGTCVDIFAPGVNVVTTAAASDSAVAYPNGTSMAAPHVAGAAALYLSANPTAQPVEVAAALLNGATEGIVTNAGLGSANRLLYTGAITSTPPAPPPDSTPPPPGADQPPTASFNWNCARSRCNFDASASADDKGITTYSWDFGDGLRTSSSTDVKVTHRYLIAATFTVTLTVTDAGGQSARVQQLVKVRKT